MRINVDGLCVRKEGQSKFRTRVSNENIGNIFRKFQEMRKDYKLRLPQHNTLTEIKTFDTFRDPRTAFVQALLGIALLRIHLNSELKMKLGTKTEIRKPL